MASAYGIAREYNRFVPPMDLSLFAQAMQVKQGKYEKNYNDLANKLDLLKNIDIIKSEDKDYLVNRTNKIVDEINRIGNDIGIDFSSGNEFAQLNSYIGTAIDSNVINAIQSTQKYRVFNEQVNQLKEKHPDKYSAVNEAYALRPFVSYLNDGKVGSKLGDLTYTNYSDVNGKYSKILNDYLKTKGNSKFDNVNPNDPYALFSDEYYGLEGEKIRKIVESQLSPDELKQLTINGWYKLGMADDRTASLIRDSFIGNKTSELDSTIHLYESKLERETNPTYRNNVAIILDNLRNQKLYFENLASAKTADEIGLLLEKENLYGSLGDLYQKELVGRQIKENTPYTKRVEHGFRQMEISLSQARLALDERKFQFDQQKYEEEKIAKEKENKEFEVLNPKANTDDNVDIYSKTFGTVNHERDRLYGELKASLGEGFDEARRTASRAAQDNGTDYVFELAKYAYEKDRSKYSNAYSDAVSMNNTKVQLMNNMKEFTQDVMKTNPKFSEEQWAQKFAYQHTLTSSEKEKAYYEALLISLGKNPDSYIPEFRKKYGKIGGEIDRLIEGGSDENVSVGIKDDKYTKTSWYNNTSITFEAAFLESIGEFDFNKTAGKYAASNVDKSYLYSTQEKLFSNALNKVYEGLNFNSSVVFKGKSTTTNQLVNAFINAPEAKNNQKGFDATKDVTLVPGLDNSYHLEQTTTNSKGEVKTVKSANLSRSQLSFLQALGIDMNKVLEPYGKPFVPSTVVSKGFQSFNGDNRAQDRYEENIYRVVPAQLAGLVELLDYNKAINFIKTNPNIKNKDEAYKLLEPGTKVSTVRDGNKISIEFTNGSIKKSTPPISVDNFQNSYPQDFIYKYPEYFIISYLASPQN